MFLLSCTSTVNDVKGCLGGLGRNIMSHSWHFHFDKWSFKTFNVSWDAAIQNFFKWSRTTRISTPHIYINPTYLKKGVITARHEVAWQLDMVVKAERKRAQHKKNLPIQQYFKSSLTFHCFSHPTGKTRKRKKKDSGDLMRLTPRNLQPCQIWRWVAGWPAMFCSCHSWRTTETICWVKTEKDVCINRTSRIIKYEVNVRICKASHCSHGWLTVTLCHTCSTLNPLEDGQLEPLDL